MHMKKTFKILAMALISGMVFTACDKKPGDDGNGNGNGGGDEEQTPWTVTNKLSGEIKAGFATSIEITGSDFEPDEDYIYIGYEENGAMVYSLVSNAVLELRRSRISIGVPITAPYIDKTVKVYLERLTFDNNKHALTDNLTFVMPAVSEGYIPDPGFRATLQSTHMQDGNPNIAVLFDSYGLLDVESAAQVTSSGCEGDYALNLYASNAKSLEGIELFTNIGKDDKSKVVAGWGSSLEEVDLSKLTNTHGLDFRFNGLPSLNKIIGAPYAYRIDVYQCDNLTHVDLSPCKWLYNLQLWYDNSPTTYSYVTYLDMRRQNSGTKVEYPSNTASEYTVFSPDSWMKVADNCKILVDYQFLLDKATRNFGSEQTPNWSCYGTVYGAWTRGATIEVYDSQDITNLIGTVPAYSAGSTAITMPGGTNSWVPEGY